MFGLKAWGLEIIIAVVLMILVGAGQYFLSGSGLRIRRRFSEEFLKLLAGVSAVIFWCLILKESSTELLDIAENTIIGPEDSVLWAIPVVAMSVTLAAFFLFIALYAIARMSAWTKKGYLTDILRQNTYKKYLLQN